jgi:hypothetical protein
MTRKDSHTSRAMEPPETDDLKLIHGISPAVEHRLHGVGIYTFAQLVTLSPADIAASVAGLYGLSAEHIIKQDWIGQSRKLAASSISVESQKTDEIPAVYPHYATFTLELLLDEDNTVRRTHITHNESGAEESWDGWQDAQLIRFFIRSADLNIPLVK